jgi:hypothetical protein
MNCLRWNPFRPTRTRRACAAVTLLAYLLVALGVPLPAGAARRRGDQPFPCQDHPCGCATAEQCWRGCCCFTPEERWAWARAHNVEPPDYAERPRVSVDPVPPPVCTNSCCVKHGTKTKVAAKPNLVPAKPGCCTTEKKPDADSKKTVRWGRGISALGCKGHATLWATSGFALPALPPTGRLLQLPPAGWLCLPDVLASHQISIPPDPPPRSSCA